MSSKKQEDYLVAILLDYFRHIENESKYLSAAKIALNQIERMAHINSSNLDKRFLYFASSLKNNISPKSLRAFAEACINCALKTKIIHETKTTSSPTNPSHLQKKARLHIASALSAGHSESSAVLRAANYLKAEQREKKVAESTAKKILNHPLRNTLSALNTGHKKLAKEDIRNHFLNLKTTSTFQNPHQGNLINMLKKAQSFSSSHLHELLGDELFHMCRPLGFQDKNDTILIIEVPSSAHLHALSYKKLEILSALKRDPNFSNARSIKFKVRSSW